MNRKTSKRQMTLSATTIRILSMGELPIARGGGGGGCDSTTTPTQVGRFSNTCLTCPGI